MNKFVFVALMFGFPLTVNGKSISTSMHSCPVTSTQLNNGFMECIFDDKVGSFCFFFCDEGYEIEGPLYRLCAQELTQQKAKWDSDAPLCIKQTGNCHQNQKADVIFAIDSSLSSGSEKFILAKDFTESFIRSFSMEENISRFSVFRYNNDVDTDSQILLRDSDDREQLLSKVQQIPNNPEGDSNIGNALRHIQDVILTEQNGDRPEVQNIVVLFTSSVSNDDVIVPAHQLRKNSDIYVIGMNSFLQSIAYLHQLESITGSVQSVILTEPGDDVEVIDEALSRRIDEFICRS